MRKYILAVLLALACFGCVDNNKQQAVQKLLQDRYGDSFTVVKSNTWEDGYAVYQNWRTGEYIAVRYAEYQNGMSYDQLLAASKTANPEVRHLTLVDNSHYEWDSTAFYDTYTQTYYGGWVWITEIDYVGHGYVFEESSSHLKDLESLGAKMDASNIDALSNTFASQYGLSEERSQEVARLVSNWSSLTKTRAMSEADLKDFSTQALGADIASFQRAAEKAAKENDSSQLDALTKRAAEVNGISVEHARKILKGFLN